ncbi:MAG: ABC transporter ATP-binding protein, partial [Azoarcus sp.]|nr:ABC transporter ATP-binding protein [Azoarcus sp.]
MNTSIMRAQNLGYRLEAEKSSEARWILRGISFALDQGELCAVLGPNGIGKSTLLRLLTSAAQPAEGQVTHQGRIGYVPQAVHPALPMTALEMTLLGRAARLSLLGAPRRRDYAIAETALQRVEASHLASRPFNKLSGGERQLVLMARALAAEADILVLDEPTAALDWHNQALILRLLAGLAKEGVTIVMSTHSPQHAFEFAHRALLIFDAGRHVFGTPGEVMDEAALSGLFHLPVRRVPLADGMAAIPIFRQAPPA